MRDIFNARFLSDERRVCHSCLTVSRRPSPRPTEPAPNVALVVHPNAQEAAADVEERVRVALLAILGSVVVQPFLARSVRANGQTLQRFLEHSMPLPGLTQPTVTLNLVSESEESPSQRSRARPRAFDVFDYENSRLSLGMDKFVRPGSSSPSPDGHQEDPSSVTIFSHRMPQVR